MTLTLNTYGLRIKTLRQLDFIRKIQRNVIFDQQSYVALKAYYSLNV